MIAWQTQIQRSHTQWLFFSGPPGDRPSSLGWKYDPPSILSRARFSLLRAQPMVCQLLMPDFYGCSHAASHRNELTATGKLPCREEIDKHPFAAVAAARGILQQNQVEYVQWLETRGPHLRRIAEETSHKLSPFQWNESVPLAGKMHRIRLAEAPITQLQQPKNTIRMGRYYVQWLYAGRQSSVRVIAHLHHATVPARKAGI